MTTSLDNSLARIYGPYGDPAGVGFCIAPGKLITCAHVVITALELDKTAKKPALPVHFDMPLSADVHPVDAKVSYWDVEKDIAILDIMGDPHAELKPAMLAASTTDVWGHEFRAFGFPENNEQGIWTVGALLGKNAEGWIQIQDTSNANGYFIQPGFSGAPVWDETLNGIVGMVVAADNSENRRIAYIVPIDSFPPLDGMKKNKTVPPPHEPAPPKVEIPVDKPEHHQLRVFLCHSKSDRFIVREVYEKLAAEGWINPWLDEENLLMGQEWDLEIEKAVEESDSVIAFLSTESIEKEGYIQKELKFVLSIAQEKPEGTIFLIPLRLDDCKPPRRVSTLQWGDYFPAGQREEKYQRLLKSLRARYEQKYTKRAAPEKKPPVIEKKQEAPKVTPKPSSQSNKVIPTNANVTPQAWSGVPIPAIYAHVGEMNETSPHFYRAKDGHLAVLFSNSTVTGEAFLIDKYAITCKQYCNFLNELADQGFVQTQIKDGEYCAASSGRTLAVDCLDRWKKPAPKDTPWIHETKPFGITYHGESWTPLPESELLPVTLITWWGARLYSLWAHEESTTPAANAFSYLPTADQWVAAAQVNPVTRACRRYPWGDEWNPSIVNFSGYRSGKNILEKDWNLLWATNSLAYSAARPIPVAEMEQNTSPVGCVHMVGNTWEWTTGTLEPRMTIKGGCVTSPMEHCDPILPWASKWPTDKAQEYIGFRCCYPIRRYA